MANLSRFRHTPSAAQCPSSSSSIRGILSQIKYNLVRLLILFGGLQVSYLSNI